MKITAITKYKHGELYSILQRLGWNQSELARQSGLYPSLIGLIINLRKRPNANQANKIQNALAAAGVFLDVLSEWPESFIGLKPGFKTEQTADIELDRLLDCPEALMIQAPEQETPERSEYLALAFDQLQDNERDLINKRWALDGGNEATCVEIGKRFGLCGATIVQREHAILRKLRNKMDSLKTADEIGVVSVPSEWLD